MIIIKTITANFFNHLRLLSIFFLIPLINACVTTKNITYFQVKGVADTVRFSSLALIEPVIPKIQADDILAVTVSSLSEESNVIFNFSNINVLTTTGFPGGNGSSNQPLGYLVDPKGSIEMPLIGKIKIAGLTLEEAGNTINRKLGNFLKEPSVNVRLLNHKFTVIGEVNRPGVYNLLDNHTTLPEVIGMAGDLTIFGRRDNVMLIRTSNGKREIVRIDLTSRDFMETPYYFIQNSDMIYIEPMKGKITSTDRTIQMLPIVTGIASTFILLLNFLIR